MNVYVKYRQSNEVSPRLHTIAVDDESVDNSHEVAIQAVKEHLEYTRCKMYSPILAVIKGGNIEEAQ